MIFGRRRAYQRKLAVAEVDGICSAHAMVARAKPKVILPEFLPFLMMSDKFMKRAVDISVGSLSPTINWTSLKLEEFDLPPLDQQRRIAEILWVIDEAEMASKNLYSELKSFAGSAMIEALEKGFPAKNGARPRAWDRKTLDDVCDLQNGHGFSAAVWAQKGLPIIRIQNLNGSREFNYFAGEVQPEWLVEPGTLLFAWAGVRGVSFGPCIWAGPLGVLNQHIYRIVPNHGINKRWLFETLRVITQKIENKAHGFKIELVHARKADITGQSITVPPPSQQEVIAKYAESLELGCTSVLKQVHSLSSMRKEILNALF